MDNILRIEGLTKEYENVVALNNIYLEMQKGTIFGLLGPNGAGKTSLIRILTGITLPDKGKFTLEYTENKDFDSLSRMIGYLPEERGLYPDMKVYEQLDFIGQIKGLNKTEIKEKLNYWGDKMGVSQWFKKKAQELSKGMQQMVQFVATVFYDPSLIILDEPFTGLDPINTNKIKKEIIELKNQGKTIIFSTHRMEQVEEICVDIALINKGNIVLKGNLEEIKNSFKKNIFKVVYEGTLSENKDYEFDIIDTNDSYLIIKDKDIANTSPNSLLKKIMQYVDIHSFVEILPTLNEIFIEQVEKISEDLKGGNNE
jgi:ABC-2 type transport system ATP-binding protein